MIMEFLNLDGRRRLPIILAAEGAECGLACLAMVGRYYGHDLDLNALRQRFPVSLSGLSLRNLVQIASTLGLSSRALRAELPHLERIVAPAILHWDLKHFVVLASFDGRKAVIHDPSHGRRVITASELSNHFTGVALELVAADSFQPVQIGRPLRISDLWSRISGLGSAAAQVLSLSLAVQFAAFVSPFFLQLTLDQGVYKSDREFLLLIALGFGALGLLQVALEAARAWTIMIFGQMFTFQIVGNLVRHLLRLRAEFFEKRHVGDILSRLNSVNPIRDAVTRGLITAIIDGLMAVVACIFLAYYSVALALIVFAAFAASLAVTWAYYPVIRRRSEESIIATAKEQTHLMETARSAAIIKLMCREPEREGAWRNLYARVINTSSQAARATILQSAMQSAISTAQTIAVVYFGAMAVLEGRGFTVGMLFAFLAYRQIFNDRASALINQSVQFRLLGLHLDRLSDIASAPLDDHASALPLNPPKGRISLRSVRFRYSAGEPWVLDGVDLDVADGEFVAIVGRSGGGKTSLMKILLGLHEPTEGTVLLDGMAANAQRWRAWREGVGFISQDDRLLGGSIAENIAFFAPDIDMNWVAEVAKTANVADEIAAMPMQYLSVVGDMGSNLSGGQKQRVLLARALYRRPRVLFLDEGTANLDPTSEETIADTVRALNCTRIVVSHRPALVERADRIFACEAGRLTEITLTKFHASKVA